MNKKKPLMITGEKLLLTLDVFSLWYRYSVAIHDRTDIDNPRGLSPEKIEAFEGRFGNSQGSSLLTLSAPIGMALDAVSLLGQTIRLSPDLLDAEIDADPIIDILERAIHRDNRERMTPENYGVYTPKLPDAFRPFIAAIACGEITEADLCDK